MRVLLVEDNPADVELMQEVLLELELGEQFELHAVEDGVQALAFLRGEEPYSGAPRADLVFLDLNTPRLGGFEVLGLSRGEGGRRGQRWVVFSSSDNPEDEARALALGADAYLVKPIGWEDFRTAVRGILTRWGGPSDH